MFDLSQQTGLNFVQIILFHDILLFILVSLVAAKVHVDNKVTTKLRYIWPSPPGLKQWSLHNHTYHFKSVLTDSYNSMLHP